MGGGGSTVNVPGPSPEERALQQEQVTLLRQQRDVLSQQIREANVLTPLLFERAGLRITRDDKGEVTGVSQIPEAELPPEQRTAAEINRRLGERSLAALKGELPTDPGLIRGLDEERTRLEDTLFRELGPGFRTSTPGIQALAEFDKRKTEILDAARRGDLTLAEQLGQAREASNLARPFSQVGATMLPSQRFAPAAGFGQIAQGFQGPLSQMASDRQMQTQAMIANAQSRAQSSMGFGQLLGMGAGLVLGTPFGMPAASLTSRGLSSIFGR